MSITSWFRLLVLVSSAGLPQLALAATQSLVDIYQEAKANDPVLASAGSANLAAQEIIEQAKAAYRPSVNLTAGANANPWRI